MSAFISKYAVFNGEGRWRMAYYGGTLHQNCVIKRGRSVAYLVVIGAGIAFSAGKGRWYTEYDEEGFGTETALSNGEVRWCICRGLVLELYFRPGMSLAGARKRPTPPRPRSFRPSLNTANKKEEK